MTLAIDESRFNEVTRSLPPELFDIRLSHVFIVGGAARYITGKAHEFRDIDIAIQCPSLKSFEFIKQQVINRYINIEAESFTISKSEFSMSGGKGVKNLCENEPDEEDRYYFDNHEFSGFKFCYAGVKVDLFAVRCIRKYVKTVPTAWDGIAIYLTDRNHYVHSVEYLSETNHMITSRPMYLFNPHHIKRQGLEYPGAVLTS